MPPKKSTKQKSAQGTLRKHREAARKKTADPKSELEDAKEALDAMRVNLRLATTAIAKKGLMVKTTVTDSHGKVTVVERPNVALKIQREAMRAINSLKKQIVQLEEEAHEKEEAGEGDGKGLLDLMMEQKQ